MNIEELKSTLTELRNNLDNKIIRNQIIQRDKNFDFDVLIQAIENYIQNLDVLADSANDMLLNQIITKAKSLLELTYSETVGVYAVKFTQYGNFLITHTPHPRKKQDKNKIDSSEDFTKDNKDIDSPSVQANLKTIQEKYYDTFMYLANIKQGNNLKFEDCELDDYHEFNMIINELEMDDLIKKGDWTLGGTYIFGGLTFQGKKRLEDIQTKTMKMPQASKINTDEKLLFPSNDLYPSDTLYPSAKLSSNSTVSADATVSQDNNINKKLKLNPSNISILDKRDIPPALGVKKIASILSSIILKQSSESGMMIGIFGKWGRGKTYLFEKILDQVKSETAMGGTANHKTYEIVRFSAWKYQDTQASWGYIYELFMEGYLADKSYFKCEGKLSWLCNKLKQFSLIDRLSKLYHLNRTKYGTLPILSFSIFLILYICWSFTIDSTTIIKFISSSIGLIVFFKLILMYLAYKSPAINLFKMFFSKQSFKDILGFQAEVQRELTILLKTWIPDSSKDKKIILFVDDLDRCYPEQIIRILDGLRIILDEEDLYSRLIIVTAIDEEILKYAVEAKYESILKEKENNKNIFKEYIEKVFLVGIKLNTLTREESIEMLNKNISENTIRPIMKNNEEINTENTDTQTQKSESHFETPIEILYTIEDDEFLIDEEEKEHLLAMISYLKNPTPRRIRIFYYKYLIFKKLLHMRFEELKKFDEWESLKNKHMIIDILIDASNDDLKKAYIGVEKSIFPEIKYVVEMISVL